MKSNKENVLNALDGSVWAITEAKLSEIVLFINNLSSGDVLDYKNQFDTEDSDEEQSLLEQAGVTIDGGTAVVPIQGTIFKRANLLTQFSGGTSTELLTKAVRKLEASDQIENVIFRIDSPGGEVGGLSEAAAAIRSLRDTKNVVSLADGSMASAAYWLGSAADKVFATRDALVGNIGTVMVHEERSEKYDDEGRTFTIFRSSPLKGAGHPSEKLSDEAKAEFQKILDDLNSEFIRNVSLNRNISYEQAEEMADARIHVGVNAVENGFADDIKTMADIQDEISAMETLEEQLQAYQAEYTSLMEQYEEAEAIIAGLRTELDKVQGEAFADKVEAKVAELTEGTDAKFAPAAADSLRERLTADFEGTLETLELIPAGAGAPTNGLPQPDTEDSDHTLEAQIAKAKAEGKKIAKTPKQAEEYEAWGYELDEDFILGFVPEQ